MGEYDPMKYFEMLRRGEVRFEIARVEYRSSVLSIGGGWKGHRIIMYAEGAKDIVTDGPVLRVVDMSGSKNRVIEVYDKDAIATIMSIAIKSIQEEIPTITDEGAKRMRSIESSYWGSLATLLEDKAEAEHQDIE